MAADDARGLRSKKLTLRLELHKMRRLRYNLPVFESYEKTEEYSLKLPKQIRFLFFVFGERL